MVNNDIIQRFIDSGDAAWELGTPHEFESALASIGLYEDVILVINSHPGNAWNSLNPHSDSGGCYFLVNRNYIHVKVVNNVRTEENGRVT